MNAVRRNDNVCFGRSAIGKAHPRHAAVLFKAGAAVARAHQAGWKRFGEQSGEPFAFVRLSGPLEKGPNDAYVEVVNLPRDVSYTKTKFQFAVKEVQKP